MNALNFIINRFYYIIIAKDQDMIENDITMFRGFREQIDI